MGVFANNAKRDLTTLLYAIQKAAQNEKTMRTLNIEDRVGPIIDSIVNEAISRIRIEMKNVQKN
jgi:hypothetical protein